MPRPFSSVWFLRVPDSLAEAADRGLSRAERRAWDDGSPLPTRVDDLMGWLVTHAFVESRLVGTVTVNETDRQMELDPTIPVGADQTERGRVAILLRRSVVQVAQVSKPEFWCFGPPKAIVRDQTTGDTGALPALAAVAIGVAASAAIAYVAHQASQVIDNALARDAKLREVVEADAAALRVIEKHVQREQDEGRTLPLDEASRQTLEALEQRQEELAKKQPPPVDSGAPDVTASSGDAWKYFAGAAAALGAALAVRSLFGG